MMRLEVASDVNVAPQPMPAKKAPHTATVLEELFVLLEDYAPAWYTKEHHDRAVRALLTRES